MGNFRIFCHTRKAAISSPLVSWYPKRPIISSWVHWWRHPFSCWECFCSLSTLHYSNLVTFTWIASYPIRCWWLCWYLLPELACFTLWGCSGSAFQAATTWGMCSGENQNWTKWTGDAAKWGIAGAASANVLIKHANTKWIWATWIKSSVKCGGKLLDFNFVIMW